MYVCVLQRKSELESRFDEDRYQWQAEKQEMQKEKVLLETKNKHLMERSTSLSPSLSFFLTIQIMSYVRTLLSKKNSLIVIRR